MTTPTTTTVTLRVRGAAPGTMLNLMRVHPAGQIEVLPHTPADLVRLKTLNPAMYTVFSILQKYKDGHLVERAESRDNIADLHAAANILNRYVCGEQNTTIEAAARSVLADLKLMEATP